MNIATIRKMCCPFDRADLQLTAVLTDTATGIQEGFLTCSLCERIYPIVKGIVIITPDEYRAPQWEQPIFEKWKKQLQDRQKNLPNAEKV